MDDKTRIHSASNTSLNKRDLSERERMILRTIVQMYVLSASPVGSRQLSRVLREELKLSAATIRNVMSDLEEMNYISHPHTSAGRMPTDSGYRLYVDSLMESSHLSAEEIEQVSLSIQPTSTESVIRDAGRVLGALSHHLSIITIPNVYNLIVRRIELIRLSPSRLLVVIALESDVVRTMTLEADFELSDKELGFVSSLVNERVVGRTLSFIREYFPAIVAESSLASSNVIRLFTDSVEQLFLPHRAGEKLHVAGTQNLLSHPEFENVEKLRGVIELVESEEMIIHLLDQFQDEPRDLSIKIGQELQVDTLAGYSMVVTKYQIGNANGAVGVIGPKRMDYARMTTLVNYVSLQLSSVTS